MVGKGVKWCNNMILVVIGRYWHLILVLFQFLAVLTFRETHWWEAPASVVCYLSQRFFFKSSGFWLGILEILVKIESRWPFIWRDWGGVGNIMVGIRFCGKLEKLENWRQQLNNVLSGIWEFWWRLIHMPGGGEMSGEKVKCDRISSVIVVKNIFQFLFFSAGQMTKHYLSRPGLDHCWEGFFCWTTLHLIELEFLCWE